jgi:hypothetical protein
MPLQHSRHTKRRKQLDIAQSATRQYRQMSPMPNLWKTIAGISKLQNPFFNSTQATAWLAYWRTYVKTYFLALWADIIAKTPKHRTDLRKLRKIQIRRHE